LQHKKVSMSTITVHTLQDQGMVYYESARFMRRNRLQLDHCLGHCLGH